MDIFYPKDTAPLKEEMTVPTNKQVERMEALIKSWKKPVPVREAINLINDDQPHVFTMTEMTDALTRVEAELNPPPVEEVVKEEVVKEVISPNLEK